MTQIISGVLNDPLKLGIDPIHPPYRATKVVRSSRINQSERVGVFICAGQSNIACYADMIYSPSYSDKVDQINILNGAILEGKDPFVGSSGTGGSWISLFADKLIQANLYDRVILVPIGVGSSTIEMWEPGGLLGSNIRAAFKRCEILKLPVTAVLWQQGESSHFSTASGYYTPMMNIINSIRAEGYDAPWFLGKSTYSTGDCLSFTTSTGTRAGVDLAVNNVDIFAGADTDTIVGSTYRSAAPGNCLHFNAVGQEAAANLWYEKVVPVVTA